MLLEGGPRLLPSYPAEPERQGQAEAAAPGRRGAHRDARDRHPAGLGRRRGLDHPDADRHLGRRQHGEPAAQDPRRAARPRGPRDRRARLHHPGHPEVFVLGDAAAFNHQEGGTLPGICPVAIQMGEYTARVIEGDLAGRPRRAVQLLGQGAARGDRPRAGGGGHLEAALRRLPRVAGLDLRPHLLPDRLPQPRAGAAPVGLVLPHLQPRRPPHHRGSQTAAGHRSSRPSGQPDTA